VIEADTVVIGAGLAAIATAPIDGLQVENYPGARFQHFTDMLKDDRGKNGEISEKFTNRYWSE